MTANPIGVSIRVSDIGYDRVFHANVGPIALLGIGSVHPYRTLAYSRRVGWMVFGVPVLYLESGAMMNFISVGVLNIPSDRYP